MRSRLGTSWTTVRRPCGSFAVETTPDGLLTRETTCRDAVRTRLPSTLTAWESSTSRAGSVITLPSTVTRPSAMIASEARREATPEWARYLASRIALPPYEVVDLELLQNTLEAEPAFR